VAPYYPIYRSGYTGPSERIGGSDPYHIDLKILSELPTDEKIKALDSLAKKYEEQGRVIEFSNQGVVGLRWNPASSPEQKRSLYTNVINAHAYRPNWDSLDYYVPLATEDRWGKSAEGAEIYLPGVEGGTVRRASGGDYGFYSEALDPTGRKMFRVGHGDINRPEEGAVINAVAPAAETPAAKTPDKVEQRAISTTAQKLLEEVIANLDKPSERSLVSNYSGPDLEPFIEANKQIEDMYIKLASDIAKQETKKPRDYVIPRQNYTNNAIDLTKMAQSAFAKPLQII